MDNEDDQCVVDAALDRAHHLEIQAVTQIRAAAELLVDPALPYVFLLEGRAFIVLPEGIDIEISGRVEGQIIEVTKNRVVVG